ncbi:Uncharacterised protein [Nocardia farcinica]|uniref:Uncharacterized protein n=1 Tax=Nocardia farcinica TaxID=37329 RepID=A0A449HDW0_NOCFR|nr:hypothetical protein [Nocardia farcinica]VFA96142.1 Uncharacterised protein [Nocardia farcinica]
MNAARATGLNLPSSSRPQHRGDLREAAARVRPSTTTDTTPAAAQPEPAPATTPAAAPAVSIPLKRKKNKRPFSTQISAETSARLDWLIKQGAVLTDTVDAAITAYLDAAGVPRPGPDGSMPDPT